MSIQKGAEKPIGFDLMNTDGTANTTAVPTCRVALDSGNFAACTNAAVRKTSGGAATNAFHLVLTAAEMAADLVTVQITATGCLPRTIVIYTEADWTPTRATNVDAKISETAKANTALDKTVWTDAKAAQIDAKISDTAKASTALSKNTWTDAKAALIDAAISGTASAADITQTRAEVENVLTEVGYVQSAMGDLATSSEVQLARDEIGAVQADTDLIQQQMTTDQEAIIAALAPIRSQVGRLIFDSLNRVLAAAEVAMSADNIADLAAQVAEAVGDPLARLVPGAYTPGQAGYALGILGTGSTLRVYTCTHSQTGAPMAGVSVACYRDAAMTQQHGSTQLSDATGKTRWLLNANTTYYFFCQRDGYTFQNPDTERFE